MSVSVFDHPWLSALLGDDEIARHFDAEAELRAMLDFEVALAAAQADAGVIPTAAAQAIVAVNLHPDMDALAAGTLRDGMVVPDWIDQMRRHIGDPHGRYLHFGSTSQDVLDTSLILRLKPALGILAARIDAVDAQLEALARKHGKQTTMARTRMQDALPITWGDRIAAWRAPLARHRQRLAELTPRLLVPQFGGPVGTLDKFGDRGPAVTAALGRKLGLPAPDRCSHNARDNLAESAGWLSLLTGGVGKIGQDVAMHHALIHEQERSGAAWTLEWMVLPQMLTATGAALARAAALVLSVEIAAAT